MAMINERRRATPEILRPLSHTAAGQKRWGAREWLTAACAFTSLASVASARSTRPLPGRDDRVQPHHGVQPLAAALEPAHLGRHALQVQSASNPDAQPAPGADVLTQRYNNQRTGATLTESILTPSSIDSTSFGKLYSLPTSGQIFAQPLFVSGATLADGSVHDLLIVADMTNQVYAFDANSPSSLSPLWQVSLGPIVQPEAMGILPATGFGHALGVLATPVIDAESMRLYVVSANQFSTDAGPNFSHHVHVIDLRRGVELDALQTRVRGSTPGHAPEAVDGVVEFDSATVLQRPALTLTRNGMLVVQFGSHDDATPTHGWEFVYNANTLALDAVYNASPNTAGNSFWNGGTGAAVDDSTGDIFTTTATGFPNRFNPGATSHASNASDPVDRTDSLLRQRLYPTNITNVDWYTPHNWQQLNADDLDFGAGGVLLPAGSSRAYATDKAGNIYNVPRENMGHVSPVVNPNTQIVNVGSAPLFGLPVYYEGQDGARLFAWSNPGVIKSYPLDDRGWLDTSNVLEIPLNDVASHSVGGMLSLSAHGRDDASAVLWAVGYGQFLDGTASTAGVLHAIDAALGTVIWSSAAHAARDSLGMFSKFCPPTVAHGKVFMATGDLGVQVFGLLPEGAVHDDFSADFPGDDEPDTSPAPSPPSFVAAPSLGGEAPAPGPAQGPELAPGVGAGSGTGTDSSLPTVYVDSGVTADGSDMTVEALASGASTQLFVSVASSNAGVTVDFDPDAGRVCAVIDATIPAGKLNIVRA